MKVSLILAAGVLGSGLAFANTPNGGPTDVGQTTQVEDAGASASKSPLLTSLKTIYADGDKEVSWGGRLMNDFGFFSKDDAYPVMTEDGFEFRRARFYAHAKLFGTVEAKAQYDFAGETATFKDVWMKFPTPFGKLQVGHFKHAFSIEEQTSSRFITFMERAAPVEAFAPSRDNGVGTGGKIGDDTNWAFGIFRRTDGAANGTGDGNFTATGRLTHHWGEGDHVTHVGVAVSSWAGMDVRFRARPEAHLVSRAVDTGTMASDSTLLTSLEAAWVDGPLSAQAELLQASVDNFGTMGDVDLTGWYAFVSYFLTGESRHYKAPGKFDRVHPNENWDGSGAGGAWELAARISSTDFDEVSGGTLTNLTAGVNWYLNPNARIMLNVVNSNLDNSSAGIDDDMTALMMRFQVDW